MSTMQDMTKGGAAGHLLRYAVPLMLGNWFQLAYNAVDSIIAGRFIGKDALAAEGIAGPVMNLVILGITGVCLGAGVLMSEFFGAKDGESLRRELGTTVLSGTAACTVVALLGVLFTPAILQACAVPREIFAITAIYLRIEEEKKLALEKKAQDAGLSLSTYLVEQGLHGKVVDFSELRKIYPQLMRIGNNINQIARTVNARGFASGEDIAAITAAQ